MLAPQNNPFIEQLKELALPDYEVRVAASSLQNKKGIARLGERAWRFCAAVCRGETKQTVLLTASGVVCLGIFMPVVLAAIGACALTATAAIIGSGYISEVAVAAKKQIDADFNSGVLLQNMAETNNAHFKVLLGQAKSLTDAFDKAAETVAAQQQPIVGWHGPKAGIDASGPAKKAQP